MIIFPENPPILKWGVFYSYRQKAATFFPNLLQMIELA